MPHKKVVWLELFNDLIFVAAIAKVTHILLHLEEGVIPSSYLLKFVLIFVPIWWAWVGQTLYINRYGDDSMLQRMFMVIQMLFIIVMTASLSVDFDPYYLPFLTGYLGIRFITAIQYFISASEEYGERKLVAKFLGRGFLFGALISLCSLFFDGGVRYLVLYLGIAIDTIIPLLGHKHLKKVPINTPHLLERFGLLTLILLGEFIVSIIVIVKVKDSIFSGITALVASFVLVIALWWQYFDNLEKKIDKESRTSGQIIIYGHLVIFMALSLLASTIQLSYIHPVDSTFLVNFSFGASLIYFGGTSIVFHKYRFTEDRLGFKHLILFLGLLGIFWTSSLLLPVSGLIVLIEMAVFFIVYSFLTVK
ncbi:low temperature requirement protein A [Fictibacillus nanhaiensis]|uniref:Low temperature requirement protein A n=1 Tax=Fictibacillus nanhaiensis TaxID=742169 RepID=A0ABS2ZMJ5_9BACL|nr:low temperature requirement protein A [Fictibacillus nanhaiensis]